MIASATHDALRSDAEGGEGDGEARHDRQERAQGLNGNAREVLKARVFLREWFSGKIRLEPLADGGLVAHWDQNEAALLRGSVSFRVWG